MKKFFVILLPIIFSAFLFACADAEEKNYNLYNLKLAYDNENNLLSGEMIFDYYNYTGETLNDICFHLYPNAFRENSSQSVVSLANYNRAYYDGKCYGDINILSSNKDFDFIGNDENILRLNLENPLNINEQITLKIEFECVLPKINHRYGVGENTINFGNVYPVLCVYENGGWNTNGYNSNGDPFYSEMANYDVQILFNDNYKIASTGEIENEYIEGENRIVNIKANNVRDFVFVLSDKFEIVTAQFNETTIKYFYYQDENPNQSLNTSVLALKTFTELFGDYPYSTLSIVEASFVHGGMEYPNLVLISDSLNSYDIYTTVIIHEIAHQWWYGIVGNDQYNYAFLDEGLAEFSTALFYEKNSNYNTTRSEITLRNQSNYNVFQKVYKDVLGSVDTSFIRSLDDFNNEQEYVYTTYVKAYLMHDSLYELLGEKKYIKCLKEYYNLCKYKTATPTLLIKAFEKGSGKNLENFFYSWFEGDVIIN